MNKEVLHRILDTQERVKKDAEYQEDLALYRRGYDILMAQMPYMTQDAQDALTDMILYGASLHFRILSIACGDDIKTAPLD